MTIIGKKGCPRCDKLKSHYVDLPYIEIPSLHIGLGDTICAMTCLLGIEPCKSCMVRRHWCNEWFPYKWSEASFPIILRKAKQMMIDNNIRLYPFVMDDELTRIIPLDCLPGYNDSIMNDNSIT